MLAEIRANRDSLEVLLTPENPVDASALVELGKTETGTVVVSHSERGLLLKKERSQQVKESSLAYTGGEPAQRK